MRSPGPLLRSWRRVLAGLLLAPAWAAAGAAPSDLVPRDVAVLGAQGVQGTVFAGDLAAAPPMPGGSRAFRVAASQVGIRLGAPVFVGPDTTVTWAWRKVRGPVCIVQFCVVNPDTGASRYLGYGAGAWSEPPSPDPTVELWVGTSPPREWTTVTRRIAEDIRAVLGWQTAEIREVYLSPWDSATGDFAEVRLGGVYRGNAAAILRSRRLQTLSRIGSGSYAPPRLKKVGEGRVERFDTAFEEAAPGRNSAANEWSAFGAPTGRSDFNCMGRDLRVRYPAFDLVFRLREGEREVVPGDLDSFRLGLVSPDAPSVRATWEHGGLRYSVGVLTSTRPGAAADLYRIEVTNRTAHPAPVPLLAGFDGPPDLRARDRVVRGLGAAPFAIVQGLAPRPLAMRAWGLCDKRARSYRCGDGPGPTDAALSSTRIGLDGLPVVYRFRAPAGGPCTVWLAASPHVSGLLGSPKRPGDLVLRYEAEGAAPRTVDWARWIDPKPRPICVELAGAHDTDGDGYVEVRACCDPSSRMRHTRLSAIVALPAAVRATAEQVVSGEMNPRALLRIDVGATPECDWTNQLYDTSDTGIARLDLAMPGMLAPGASRVAWVTVPPIHRRDPTSMGAIAHAFREVRPGEAVPAFGERAVRALRSRSPGAEWDAALRTWRAAGRRAAGITVPDAVLGEVYRSRLAVRSILDVRFGRDAWFNACSPWFYFDFAFRDQAYAIYAYDLAGMHDRARRLLGTYCTDVRDLPPGPTGFAEQPIRPGILPDGLWNTRPGQLDTQGQNLWCLFEHYRLTGDRAWLRGVAYPAMRRGAQWLVRARRRHMAQIRNPRDPRYGLLPPGAMEVGAVTSGMHMYYMDAWGVLGLRCASEAAGALGLAADRALFGREAAGLRASLHRSCQRTFRRSDLYEGNLWFGVESAGDGMYGMWGHTPLLWPTRSFDPHDPMLEATLRRMDRNARDWGGGVFSENAGSCWPYIGVDWAIGSILRGEPDRALEYFCAFTDTAGHTFSWGEGYENARNVAAGDQPHMWADAQWVNLYRHLLLMEDGDTLLLTPATMRRWQASGRPVRVVGAPSCFGRVSLEVRGAAGGRALDYRFRIDPRGDQGARRLAKVVVAPRLPGGAGMRTVTLDGRPIASWAGETIVIPAPSRSRWHRLRITASAGGGV